MADRKRRTILTILTLVILTLLAGCGPGKQKDSGQAEATTSYGSDRSIWYQDEDSPGYSSGSGDEAPDEHGSYTTKEDVANYLIHYERLPDNFITKKEARSLGWSGGSLERYAPGKCIGGDRFGNYEELLPDVRGRTYYECDIDTLGKKKRGAKRIIYSDDGNIYYTDDHYKTFTLLYGDDGQ